MSFSDRWTVRTPVGQPVGARDVVSLLRRAADYVESLGPVFVTGVELHRDATDGGETLALTASFDRTRMPVDLDYLDPRMAENFDDGVEPRDDFDFMLALASDVDARSIIDLGCGTGRLATCLARDGRRVLGVDPAPAMIEVARRRGGGEHVEWRVGDAKVLGHANADLVVMTGNVSGYIVEDAAWDELLGDVHAALRPGGHLAFGSRNLEARAWERWNHDGMELISVDGDRVRVDGHIVFAETGEELVAGSEYRFRTVFEVTGSLKSAGFDIERLYGDWLGAPFTETSEEIVVVARRS